MYILQSQFITINSLMFPLIILVSFHKWQDFTIAWIRWRNPTKINNIYRFPSGFRIGTRTTHQQIMDRSCLCSFWDHQKPGANVARCRQMSPGGHPSQSGTKKNTRLKRCIHLLTRGAVGWKGFVSCFSNGEMMDGFKNMLLELMERWWMGLKT